MYVCNAKRISHCVNYGSSYKFGTGGRVKLKFSLRTPFLWECMCTEAGSYVFHGPHYVFQTRIMCSKHKLCLFAKIMSSRSLISAFPNLGGKSGMGKIRQTKIKHTYMYVGEKKEVNGIWRLWQQLGRKWNDQLDGVEWWELAARRKNKGGRETGKRETGGTYSSYIAIWARVALKWYFLVEYTYVYPFQIEPDNLVQYLSW